MSACDPKQPFKSRAGKSLMLRLFSLPMSIFLLASSLAYGGDVGISGSVSVNGQGHAILSLKLINDSETAVCFEDWFPSRTELVVDRWLVDSFIVKDEEGNDVRTPEPRIRSDVGPPTLNRRVYMLKKGEDAEALIDLSSWYEFNPGSYTVSYLLSTLPCNKYADPESSLMSSGLLAYHLATADNLVVIRILTSVAKYENLVFLWPVQFQIPTEQVNEND